MWPWSKNKATPHASPEATQALARGQEHLAQVRQLREQAGVVKTAAAKSLASNNYGLALTAAMRGNDR